MTKDVKDVDYYIEQTIESMKELGIYKSVFDPIIEIYGGLLFQRAEVYQRYVKNGLKNQTKSSGGMKTSPLVAILRDLNKQIITYSDRLGLSPKALESLRTKEVEDSESQLIKALRGSVRNNDGSTTDFI